MKAMLKPTFAGIMLVASIAGASAQTQTLRVVGTIEGVDGRTLAVKTKADDVKVNVTDNVMVFGVVKRTLADIKPGQFLGVGAMPQPDGNQKAVRINIFPTGQSPNPGFRPWAGAPQGTMTNGTVDTSVAGVEGHTLSLKYKDGEKKIIVTPQTQIVASVPGDRAELKPGAAIAIVRAEKKPDGTFEADRINVGRDGVVPQ
jgi:outer membrane lipoprotein SlyB